MGGGSCCSGVGVDEGGCEGASDDGGSAGGEVAYFTASSPITIPWSSSARKEEEEEEKEEKKEKEEEEEEMGKIGKDWDSNE